MRDLTLSDEIIAYFPNHDGFVVKNLLITSWSILEARSTNLNIAKDYTSGILGTGEKVAVASHYMRLIRFFKVDTPNELASCILTVCCVFLKGIGGKSGSKYLLLDGTEWEIGSRKIQFLTLCILWQGVAIPLWWTDLEKIGHSSQKERKDFIINALKRYDLQGMILLADREYIGEDWFEFLSSKGIDFVIRLKSNVYHHQVNTAAGLRQSHLKHKAMAKKDGQFVSKSLQFKGRDYQYVIVKNSKTEDKEPLLFFLTSLKKVAKAVKAYSLRWKIETCFKHLKSNGFDLEAMNIRGQQKKELMMAIVVFLYVLAIKEGILIFKKAPNAKKHYKYFKITDTTTLAISFFRKGISELKRKINNFKELCIWLKKHLKVFSKPCWCNV